MLLSRTRAHFLPTLSVGRARAVAIPAAGTAATRASGRAASTSRELFSAVGSVRTPRHVRNRSDWLMTSPKSAMVEVEGDAAAPAITLDATEAKLINLLQLCSDWINTTRPQPNPERGGTAVNYDATLTADADDESVRPDDPFVTTRIAGGWVRDKLLGQPSHDLDVSISGMTGLNFALLFQDYLEQESSRHEVSPAHEAASAMSRITKISANPEQSKALETATANIFGLSVDFVNLRKEVYQGDSRIPTMTFGTPKEDAERRDICFNALLYNIRTGVVEDWTGRGLKDLRDGIVRTPLPPLTTFLDDPLRVLRCIRFASRFNYVVHAGIGACLTGNSILLEGAPATTYSDDPRVRDIPADEMLARGRVLIRDALRTKVSRERVGVEVDKMMAGPGPLRAHHLLKEFDLYSLVFHPDFVDSSDRIYRSARDQEPIVQLMSASEAGRSAVDTSMLLDALSSRPAEITQDLAQKLQPCTLQIPPRMLATLNEGGETRRILQFMAALLPFKDVELGMKKGKWIWVGEDVLMQGLKLSRNLTTAVHSILRSISMFSNPPGITPASHSQYVPNLPDGIEMSEPVLLTFLLRDKGVQNPTLSLTWPMALVAALVHDLQQSNADATSVAKQYAKLAHQIESQNLHTLSQSAPLLNGQEILATLQMRPTRLMQPIQTALLIWQFENAIAGRFDSGTEDEHKQAAREWLQMMWAEGKIVPFDAREAVSTKGKGKK